MFDYSGRKASIDRQSALVDLMLQKALTAPNGQMVGDFYVPDTGGKAIAGLAAALGTYGRNNREADFTKDKQAALAEALSQYQQVGLGSPQERLEAAQGLSLSEIPELQALGQQDMKILLEALKPQSKTVNDTVLMGNDAQGYSPQAGQSYYGPEYRQEWAMDADGRPALAQRERRSNKLGLVDQATRVTQNTTNNGDGIPSWADKFNEKTGTEAALDLSESAKKAQASQGTLRALERLEALYSSKGGTFSGKIVPVATFATSLLQGMGIPLDDATRNKLANTETSESQIQDLLLQKMEAAGGARGLTAEETAQIREALPSAKNSPEARRLIIGIMRDLAKEDIKIFQMKQNAQKAALEANDPQVYFDLVTKSRYQPVDAGGVEEMREGADVDTNVDGWQTFPEGVAPRPPGTYANPKTGEEREVRADGKWRTLK